MFAGGMDRGVQRRLLVIPFNRVIPREERVEAIGRRIAEEEPDLLLAWAVTGAARLIQNRDFGIPASCKATLSDWLYGSDPVLAWLDDRVQVRPVSFLIVTLQSFMRFPSEPAARQLRTLSVIAIARCSSSRASAYRPSFTSRSPLTLGSR